ncbi:MAG: hypothetical protein ABIN91_19425 [Mucilaginibacter sp.]|jgi:F0F1-type ATP synthase alpha subunit|uniref:hypothetical protein n=1 Tax=Mucilaginibacter sp. TaxID=1882438 RepID=UPI003263E014
MKRTILIFCLFFLGCSTTKTVVTEESVINQHPKPIKVLVLAIGQRDILFSL